jgi:VIT1/CCC1 family predicted Fe2+/Mn2+ transporter
MNRAALALVLLMGIIGLAKAQQIEVTNKLAGTKYVRGEDELSARQVQQILQVDETLADQFKKSRNLSTYSGISGFAGGILVLIPVSTLILGGENPEWVLAGVGAGLVGVSIGLSKKSGQHAQQAIEQYNLLHTKKSSIRPTLQISAQGIGISIKF